MPVKTAKQLFHVIDEQGSRMTFHVDLPVGILSSWPVNGSDNWTGLN